MKTKIKHKRFILIILTSILLFNTCKKDCDPNNPPTGDTVDLGQEDKISLFPYKDFDTMKFIKNNTDTVLFLGGKFETGYNTGLTQDPNCPRADKLQYMKLIFTNKLNGAITFYEYRLGQPLDYGTEYSITFNDRTFGPSNEVYGYRDSTKVSIRGITYTNVFKFNGASTIDNLYFVHGFGILKIIYKNDTYDKLP